MIKTLPVHGEVSENVWFARKLGLFGTNQKEILEMTVEYWDAHKPELEAEAKDYFKSLGVKK